MKKYQVWIRECLYHEPHHTFVFEGTLSEIHKHFPVTQYPPDGWIEVDEFGDEIYRSHFFMVMKMVRVLDDYPTWIDGAPSGYWENQWCECEDPRVK